MTANVIPEGMRDRYRGERQQLWLPAFEIRVGGFCGVRTRARIDRDRLASVVGDDEEVLGELKA